MQASNPLDTLSVHSFYKERCIKNVEGFSSGDNTPLKELLLILILDLKCFCFGARRRKRRATEWFMREERRMDFDFFYGKNINNV